MTDNFERQLRARTRIDKLMALATHPDTPPHEAANARAQAEKMANMYQIPLVGGAPTRPVVRAPPANAKVDLAASFAMFRGSIKKQHPVSYLDEEDDK